MLDLAPKLVAVLLATGTMGALCTGPSIPKATPPVSGPSHPAPPAPTWPASAGESVSGGDFTCSGLLPGVSPNLAGGNTPGTCNETVTFSNTGTTSEDIDVILGRPYGSGAAVAALDQLLVSYATNDHGGYTSLSYAAITSSLAQPMQVASLEPRQSITVRLALSLAGGVKGSTANAWNGATVYLPYMVTATVSASAPVGGPPIVVKVVPHLTIAAVGPWTLFANQLVHCRI